jgi:hypothetical protein
MTGLRPVVCATDLTELDPPTTVAEIGVAAALAAETAGAAAAVAVAAGWFAAALGVAAA